MFKRIIIFSATLIFTTSAYALIDNNTIQQQQGQAQGQIGVNEQDQDQKQKQRQYNKNYNQDYQGQYQGNLGIQKGNDVKTIVDVEGDDFEAYSFSAPGLSANKGVSEANVYSVFGGIGIANTEEWQVMVERLAVIERLEASGYITSSIARAEALEAYAQFKDATQPKRAFGFLWKTRGKNLGNLFGLAAMDDLRSKMPKPKKSSKDRGLGGNMGYVN